MVFQEKQDVWTTLAQTHKPIVLYGTGNGADKLFRVFDDYGIKVSDIFVSDEFYRGQTFHDFSCLTFSMIQEKYDDCIVVLAFAAFRPDLLAKIKTIMEQYEVLAPEVSVFGTDYFSMETINQYSSNIDNLYSILADEKSKEVFASLMEYKISGKIQYLFNCETPREEVFQNIIQLGDQETYVDLGAYRGDTIDEFLQMTDQRFSKIFALEPDLKNYKKLTEYVATLPDTLANRISLWNKASWSKEQILSFDGGGGRNSNIGEGKFTVHGIDVDGILNGQKVTYIKMDVEGAESETISGLSKTLRQWKPALAISAYHHTGDLFTLPFEVLNKNSEYRIFLRHHPYIPAWETNFYCI